MASLPWEWVSLSNRDLLEGYLAQVKRERPRLWERLWMEEKSFVEQLRDLQGQRHLPARHAVASRTPTEHRQVRS